MSTPAVSRLAWRRQSLRVLALSAFAWGLGGSIALTGSTPAHAQPIGKAP